MKKAAVILLSIILINIIDNRLLGDGENSVNSNALKIERIELRIDGLERRLQQLEKSGIANDSDNKSIIPQTSSSTGWKDNNNWRKLLRGMTMSQVKSILGDPVKVDVGSIFVYWYYPDILGGKVRFNTSSNKVEGWEEP